MALTQPQIDDAARKLIQKIFVSDNATAHSDFTDIQSAISQLDTAMNATTTQVETAYSGVVLKSALLQYAQVGASNLTAQEGGIALAYWALKEVGLL